MVKVVLFGTGSLSKLLTQHIRENVEIVAYLLSDGSGNINGIPIISFNQLESINFDYVVVAFGDSIKGIKLLRNAGISDDKIIGYAYIGQSYAENVFQQEIEKIRQQKIKDYKIPELFSIPQRGMYLCGTNALDNRDIIYRDYVREQTLSLIAKEIEKRSVPGVVAEIGVSSGEFAHVINSVFPDRTLYLFDTFEGLNNDEISIGLSLGWGEASYVSNEKGVAEEVVLGNMPYREKCIIKKGHFPESFDLTEKIAFASIDIDFYDSTKRGLEVLYPCLSKGGYIMVHDYNNIEFEECNEAVTDFCLKNDVPYIPVPDTGGTIVITK